MKIFKRALIASALMLAFFIAGSSHAQAQCASPAPGQGFVINQIKADPYMGSFFDRGSSKNFNRSVTVDYLSNGYRITILDTPKSNNGNFAGNFPFSFVTVIEVDCNYNLVAIAQS